MEVGKPTRVFAVTMMAVLLGAVPALAQTTLTVVENQVTATSFFETTPTLGNDGAQDLVVFTSREMLNTGMFDQADIYYQPLLAGQANGAPVQVTASLTDDVLNDVSGDYIVYTAFDDTTSLTGAIMLYRISTGQLRALGDAGWVRDPKIHGHYVIWLQGAPSATEVILYDIHTNISQSLAGPVPPTFHVEIGSRFAAWASLDGDYDIEVFDFALDARYAITATSRTDERYVSTSGDWIGWEARDVDSPQGRIEVYNGTTGEMRVIADDGSTNRLPSLDDGLIAWESNVNGNFDVFVHRFDISETFQVTFDPGDQYLNDLYGGLVAYVDGRSGDEDIYVASLMFTEPNPCAELGGDTDGDGICDADDNCPADANPAQEDSDGDGAGDVCDIDEPPPPIDAEALCAAEELPAGVGEIFAETWTAECDDGDDDDDDGDDGDDDGDDDDGDDDDGDDDDDDDDGEKCRRGRGHGDDGHCGKIKETYAVAGGAGSVVVACLTVDPAEGHSQRRAPKGWVKWNGNHIFWNPDFRAASSTAVADALADNELKVKLKLRGKHHDSTVGLRILEVQPDSGTVLLDASAGVCGAGPGASGLAVFALLLGLSRRRRRR